MKTRKKQEGKKRTKKGPNIFIAFRRPRTLRATEHQLKTRKKQKEGRGKKSECVLNRLLHTQEGNQKWGRVWIWTIFPNPLPRCYSYIFEIKWVCVGKGCKDWNKIASSDTDCTLPLLQGLFQLTPGVPDCLLHPEDNQGHSMCTIRCASLNPNLPQFSLIARGWNHLWYYSMLHEQFSTHTYTNSMQYGSWARELDCFHEELAESLAVRVWGNFMGLGDTKDTLRSTDM